MNRRTRLAYVVSGTLSVTVLAFLLTGAAGGRYGGGTLRGAVWGYNMYDEAIPLVWARVSAYSDGVLVGSVSTGLNGSYIMFLPSGLLNVTVEHPGFKTQSKVIAISEGGVSQMNFYLERSEVPIPEFEVYLLPFIAVALLALTNAVARKRRR